MKKMSTVYEMNRETGLVFNKVRPENQWVVDGEGVATIKFDGTACTVINGQLYKRFDRKLNKKGDALRRKQGASFVPTEEMFRVLPVGAIPCIPTFDPVTFHFPHWVPVVEGAPEDTFHNEGLKNFVGQLKEGQTYELVGPKIGKNHYNLDKHELWEHGSVQIEVTDRTFEGLKTLLISLNEEGLVFHHNDGRMAKIRRGDFSTNDRLDWDWKDAKPEDFA